MWIVGSSNMAAEGTAVVLLASPQQMLLLTIFETTLVAQMNMA